MKHSDLDKAKKGFTAELWRWQRLKTAGVTAGSTAGGGGRSAAKWISSVGDGRLNESCKQSPKMSSMPDAPVRLGSKE